MRYLKWMWQKSRSMKTHLDVKALAIALCDEVDLDLVQDADLHLVSAAQELQGAHVLQ